MEESVLELMKEQKQAQESRILELQEKNINSNVNSLQIHPDYDLYQDHHYLYLNVNLPGVLEQELKVDLNQGEIIIQGEFPDLCTSEDVEFLERHRSCGFFEKNELARAGPRRPEPAGAGPRSNRVDFLEIFTKNKIKKVF